jgi:hypothetical protein
MDIHNVTVKKCETRGFWGPRQILRALEGAPESTSNNYQNSKMKKGLFLQHLSSFGFEVLSCGLTKVVDHFFGV